MQGYAVRPDSLRSENQIRDTELLVDFVELQQYETDEDQWSGDHVDPYATYSLTGHSSLPNAYNDDARPDTILQHGGPTALGRT